MKDLKPGEELELGLIPCKKCDERHVLVAVTHDTVTWKMNGHDYQEKDPRTYIQEQRDFINVLLRKNRQLKSRLTKLRKKVNP